MAVAAYLRAHVLAVSARAGSPPADLHRPTPPPAPTDQPATTDARQWHLFGTDIGPAPPAAGTDAPETTST
ncbi:hypothetical protein HML84_05585 [Alcanivorax sp. IO_7]|nr:hypothetical protein HML84_05585 [Alcanivorax sp. IO_7]